MFPSHSGVIVSNGVLPFATAIHPVHTSKHPERHQILPRKNSHLRGLRIG